MMNYIETTIYQLEDLFKLSQDHLSKFIYRGQKNSQWRLETSLERLMKSKFGDFFLEELLGMEFWEKHMIKEFQKKFHIYSNKHIPFEDYIQWINIMQHHGTPTRLLDFSESFYIALYFSCNFNENESSVFFVNHNKLFDNSIKILGIENSEVENLTKTLQEITEYFPNTIIANQINLIKDPENYRKSVLPYFPKFFNERISRQRGLFLMPTNSCFDFETNLANSYKTETIEYEYIEYNDLLSSMSIPKKVDEIDIIKLNIPLKLQRKVLISLKGMNITAETLFPGLDGLAQSITQELIYK